MNDKIAELMIGKKIAGDIVFADDHGAAMKKWRRKFKITQREIAATLGIMPSVISDYESSRRKSPGIRVVRRYIEAMIHLDKKRGGKVMADLSKEFLQVNISDAIIEMKEFDIENPVGVLDRKLGLRYYVEPSKEKAAGVIYLDAMKAIINMSYPELVKMFSMTNDMILILDNINNGRTSLPVIKLTGLRPSLVVLVSSNEPDDLAIRVARDINVGLATTPMKRDDIIKVLRERV